MGGRTFHATGPAEAVDINGVPGYVVPEAMTGPSRQALEARLILVKGERGDYLTACWYGKHTEEQVLAGCEMLRDTLVETPRGQ